MKKEFVTDCGGIQPKESVTELVFILDKSGSMAGMESDTIGGFNSMIEKQKAEEALRKANEKLEKYLIKVNEKRASLEAL